MLNLQVLKQSLFLCWPFLYPNHCHCHLTDSHGTPAHILAGLLLLNHHSPMLLAHSLLQFIHSGLLLSEQMAELSLRISAISSSGKGDCLLFEGSVSLEARVERVDLFWEAIPTTDNQNGGNYPTLKRLALENNNKGLQN